MLPYRWLKVVSDNSVEAFECAPDTGLIAGVLVIYDPLHDCMNVYYPDVAATAYEAFMKLVKTYIRSVERTLPPRQSGQDPGQG